MTHDQFRFWISSPVLSDRENSLLVLRKLVLATCLRRTKAHPYLSSTLNLPRKTERVEIVELLPEEREMYDFFKRRSHLLASKGPEADSNVGPVTKSKRRRVNVRASASRKSPPKSMGNIIVLISVLRLICDHGQALLPHVALKAWQSRNDGSVSWSLLRTASEQNRGCCVCGDASSIEDAVLQDPQMSEFTCKKHLACETCLNSMELDKLVCLECSAPGMASPASSAQRNTNSPPVAPSSKVSALLKNITAMLESHIHDDEKSSPRKRYCIFLSLQDWITVSLKRSC